MQELSVFAHVGLFIRIQIYGYITLLRFEPGIVDNLGHQLGEIEIGHLHRCCGGVETVAPEDLHVPWTHILDGADELTVGIHYGSTARIDFAAHTNREQKPSEVAALFVQPQVVKAGLSKTPRLRIEALTVERNRVKGSVVLPGKQFDAWLEDIYRIRTGNATPGDAKAH
jgi:hypothetical protein